MAQSIVIQHALSLGSFPHFHRPDENATQSGRRFTARTSAVDAEGTMPLPSFRGRDGTQWDLDNSMHPILQFTCTSLPPGAPLRAPRAAGILLQPAIEIFISGPLPRHR